MLNKLLPLTLIASFALPFIAKADELPAIEQSQPAVQGLTKQQTDFMTLVAAAVYIERYKSPECTEKIATFLNAVRKEVLPTEKNILSLIFASRKLDAQRMADLQEDLDEATQTLLARYKERGNRLIAVGIALAAPAMPGKRIQ